MDINVGHCAMPLRIANPAVVDKVGRLARATGLTKTAAVERAVDRLLSEIEAPTGGMHRIDTLLAQLDAIPDRPDAFDGVDWDDAGLPR